jgi:hypothetical protein
MSSGDPGIRGQLAVTVSGPITSGSRGNAFGASVLDLAGLGFMQEEYFVSGQARAYGAAPGTSLGEDGLWDVRPNRSAPFTTRFLVTRPKDPARFSGVVMLSWLNVTAGYEIVGVSEAGLRAGDASVAVSVQRAGIYGLAGGEERALRGWDPARYGNLEHPGDDFSFDIFTTVARVVGRDRGELPVDPMGGLSVRRVIATGGSQSAIRLTSYLNGIHSLEHVLDAAMPSVSTGYATVFETEDLAARDGTNGLESIMATMLKTRIRDDLDIPVLMVTTETEAVGYLPSRQPDSDRFRTWEIAGAAHSGAAGANENIVKMFARDGLPIPPGMGAAEKVGPQPNSISYLPVMAAAARHLAGWADGGAPPPTAEFITFEGDPPEIVRDEHGNALGGLRMPELEVPVATYRGVGEGDQLASLSGSTTVFPTEKLRALYRDKGDYLSRYEAAVQRGVEQGFFLAEDSKSIVASADARWGDHFVA